MRSSPFQRVDSCTSRASPRPSAMQQDRGEHRVLQREQDRVAEEPVVDRLRVVVGEVRALVAGEQRPVASADILQHEQQRQHEQDEHEQGGRQRVEPAGAQRGGVRRRCAAWPPSRRRRRGTSVRLAAGSVAVIGAAFRWRPVRRRRGTGRRPTRRRDYCESTAVISSLSASTVVAVAEHRVAHQGQPRAVRCVERLLEVERDRGVALAGDLVDRDQARVLVRSTRCPPGRSARPRRCSWPARRPARPRTSSS